ncbi:STAS domain-containing protein [Streptomyces sp. NPDC059008]|uniref:STAS domain-containing protein n=1 Tax=unclassified Streptomyces TaxID=2593676 RepID=UPI0036B4EF2C
MTDSARSLYEAALRRIRTKRQLRRAGVKSVRVTRDVAVVTLHGPIGGGQADALSMRLRQWVQDGARELVLDIEAVPTLTTAGADAFVPALGVLCRTGGHLTVRGANQQVIKTLTRMGLASLTGITPPEPPSTP